MIVTVVVVVVVVVTDSLSVVAVAVEGAGRAGGWRFACATGNFRRRQSSESVAGVASKTKGNLCLQESRLVTGKSATWSQRNVCRLAGCLLVALVCCFSWGRVRAREQQTQTGRKGGEERKSRVCHKQRLGFSEPLKLTVPVVDPAARLTAPISSTNVPQVVHFFPLSLSLSLAASLLPVIMCNSRCWLWPGAAKYVAQRNAT